MFVYCYTAVATAVPLTANVNLPKIEWDLKSLMVHTTWVFFFITFFYFFILLHFFITFYYICFDNIKYDVYAF